MKIEGEKTIIFEIISSLHTSITWDKMGMAGPGSIAAWNMKEGVICKIQSTMY